MIRRRAGAPYQLRGRKLMFVKASGEVRRQCVAGLAAAAALFGAAHAQLGGLAVAPTRVVFEGRERSESVTLINQSDKEQTYRVFFEQRRMNAEGVLEDASQPAPGELHADALIRFSPRQVTIAPGSTQTIRLLARAPGDLASGEYRSHLVFQTVPDNVGVSIEAPTNDKEISVNLVPIYGVSIPVILRRGDLSAQSRIVSARVEKNLNGQASYDAVIDVAREGDRSAYLDFAVSAELGGDAREIGRAVGIAVYVPNASRTVRIPLEIENLSELSGARLTVTAFDKENDDAVIGASEIALAN